MLVELLESRLHDFITLVPIAGADDATIIAMMINAVIVVELILPHIATKKKLEAVRAKLRNRRGPKMDPKLTLSKA